jgi:hypothetical protein
MLNTTLGPRDIGVVTTVLDEWCSAHSIIKNSTDAGIAASVLLNLFREGNNTIPELRKAAEKHKWMAHDGHTGTAGDLKDGSIQ